jgi:HlyD family secretion protein
MKRLIPVFLILGLVAFMGYRAYVKAQEEKRNDLFYGTVEATEVIVSAQVAGQLVQFPVAEGQLLKKGDEIAHIDDSPYKAALGQAEALVKAAGSQQGVVSANLGGVNTEVQRTQKLLNAGSATDMQMNTVQTQHDVLKAQQQAVAAQVNQAKAAVKVVETQLAFTQVSAPITGTVLRTHVEQGDTVFPGSALLAMADLTSLEIHVYVPEPMLGKVKIGQAVDVFNDSYPGKAMRGKVSYVSDTAEFTPKNVQTKDERVRLVYKIKVIIPNPDGVLKIGMPVDVRFLAS